MKDPIETLGQKLPSDGGEQRDAIHVAILPVISDDAVYALSRSDPIKFVYGRNDLVIRAAGAEYDDPGIGVVDPFLTPLIHKGERFWMFLHPNTITGLRHDWHHPLVDSLTSATVSDGGVAWTPGSMRNNILKRESEVWIRRFAGRWNFNYDDLIASAVSSDEYAHITAGGIDLHSADELGEEHPKFWHHLEILTGQKFDQKHVAAFGWSCTC